MLNKRIDLGSIPLGLYEAGENLTRGEAVVRGEGGKIYRPATVGEADAVLGFVDLVTDTPEGADVEHDAIPAGKKVIVRTLVKNNMWGTTEYAGTVAAGDGLVVGYETAAGKLRAPMKSGEDERPVLFTCECVYAVGTDTGMIDVKVN